MRVKILILSILVISSVSKAQFENKITAYGSLLIPFFEEGSGVNAESVYNGYPAIPALGGGAYYHFNTKFSVGASLQIMFNTKEFYTLSHTDLGLNLKYNFVHNDKFLSPYIILQGNIGHVYIRQEENEQLIEIENTDPAEVVYKDQLTSQPDVLMNLFPVLGYSVRLGTDITLKQSLGLFVAGGYLATNAADQEASKENFPDNTSQLKYFFFEAGVKFSFIKSKHL